MNMTQIKHLGPACIFLYTQFQNSTTSQFPLVVLYLDLIVYDFRRIPATVGLDKAEIRLG